MLSSLIIEARLFFEQEEEQNESTNRRQYSSHIKRQIIGEDILSLLEKPKSLELGDVAFPCFTLAKCGKITAEYRGTDSKSIKS